MSEKKRTKFVEKNPGNENIIAATLGVTNLI